MRQLPPFCMYEIINLAESKIEDLKDYGITIEVQLNFYLNYHRGELF